MNTKHLKAKILDLAIRGKLVPQDSSEGNASDLLQKIRDEKSELVKQKKIKEDKNASFIIKADDGKHYEQFADGSLKDIEDEIPFEVPENWCWIKLGEISKSIIAGGDKPAVCTTEKTETNTIPIFANAISKNGLYGFTNKPQVTEKAITISARGTIGFTCIREEPFVPIVRLITLVPNLELVDLKYLKSAFDVLLNMTEGSSIPQLTIPTIKTFNLPLPPLSEQKRIVSAIEKAFEQIDIIEKNKLNLKTYIKQTKSKVLDLAIHGKLVEQNPQEGNAFELLEKIRSEKAELVKQKKIKEDKNASFIIKADNGKHYEQFTDGRLKDVEEVIPFEIPENWCWCRLTSICDYGKCKNAAPSELLPDSWILDLEDIEKGTGKIKKFVNFSERNSLSTKHVFTKGDILYSKLRPYLNKVVIAPKDGFCTSEILPLDFNGVYINNFAQRLLMSPYFLSTVNMLTYGVKMPRLGTGEANQILLPLPPLSEQKRIVAKIEQVFEQLDRVEKSMGE